MGKTSILALWSGLYFRCRLRLSYNFLIGLAYFVASTILLNGIAQGENEAHTEVGQLNEFALESSTAEQLEAASIRAVKDNQKEDDPTRDGWDTEAFILDAEKQLDRLAEILGKPAMLDSSHVQNLVTEEFRCSSLLPDKVREIFRDGSSRIFHLDPEYIDDSTQNQGVSGSVAALRTLLSQFSGASIVKASFKIFSVQRVGDSIITRQYVTFSGLTNWGNLAQNATWTIHWRRPPSRAAPRIEQITLDEYQHVLVGLEDQTLFSDCTKAVLGHNESFQLQLMHGINYWMPRIQARLGLDPFGHQGVAVGDVNGDGLDDLYVCQTGGLPNRMFIQNEDGTASDVSVVAGVNLLDLTRSALLIDVDNDGDQDLILALSSALLFMANDGEGKFLDLGRVPINGEVFSLSAADYDQDGDLDLYVCVYRSYNGVGELGAPIPYHDANNGGVNVLLRNDSALLIPSRELPNQAEWNHAWKFTDVTNETGLSHNNTRWSFASSWEDFDNDNDLDLYVANDYGRNNLYRNNDGHFVDVAEEVGVEDLSAGMGVTWGDYNRDGLMDLYVSNMFSSAGSRITDQVHFKTNTSGEIRTQYRRHTRGNSLFENSGGHFRDVSVDAGVTMGRWAWGSKFLDINNNGWEDLFVANGFVTNQKLDDL